MEFILEAAGASDYDCSTDEVITALAEVATAWGDADIWTRLFEVFEGSLDLGTCDVEFFSEALSGQLDDDTVLTRCVRRTARGMTFSDHRIVSNSFWIEKILPRSWSSWTT